MDARQTDWKAYEVLGVAPGEHRVTSRTDAKA